MRRPSDETNRKRVLTDLDSSLMVEAGAGTGKTALLAGRLVMLLASGIDPKSIAAITFTELAASELSVRVSEYVTQLVRGEVPPDLRIAFPDGVGPEQQANLERARENIDEITCTTIHGFCYRLINPYPVESGLDPGASPMDESAEQLLYQTVHANWLRERFSATSNEDDALADFIVADAEEGLKQIGNLSEFLRHHREAKPPASGLKDAHFGDFLTAAEKFSGWYAKQSLEETDTAAIVEALQKLAGKAPLARSKSTFKELWEWAQLERDSNIFTNDGRLKAYKKKKKWQDAAKAKGRPGSVGDAVFGEAASLYSQISETFDALKTQIAGDLVCRFASALNPLQERFLEEKRAAALLDFDDLLYMARDLLRRDLQVRQALAKRYRYVLVDEYQDTDPIQAEVLFLLCGDGKVDEEWTRSKLRPGQLFIVGDPKQSIFRFRHADIRTYLKARASFVQQFPENCIDIVANFRSLPGILDYVNRRFKDPLSAEGQAGYANLSPFVADSPHQYPTVAALDIEHPEGESPGQDEMRQAEARQVTELCSNLIGNLKVRKGEETVACQAGHIALLAPTGTGLWYYERALEEAGIPISSQAGKGFFQRQEVKDLIAIARILADSTDTLAFGALMRGPLVGLTEQEILEVISGLESANKGSGKFSLWSDPSFVNHPVACETLRVLQGLGRKAQGTSPFNLMNAAAEDLRVRPILRQRYRFAVERALSNVDLFLEMARPYAVRGIVAFARDMSKAWEDAEREIEGRSDPTQDALHVITVHSAKGLEWPVVIPINTLTGVQAEKGIIFSREDETLHMRLGDLEPASYSEVRSKEDEELNRERVRLWYVMCTRARDLLVLPRHKSVQIKKSWQSIVDLGLEELPTLDVSDLQAGRVSVPAERPNNQDRTTFEKEQLNIAEAHPKVVWIRPSALDEEGARQDSRDSDDGSVVIREQPGPEIAGSAVRGLVLHKLMEEILSGLLQEEAGKLSDRAETLTYQLSATPSSDPAKGPCPKEMAETIMRTLNLPLVRDNRKRLVTEVNVRRAEKRGPSVLQLASGVADAIAPTEAGGVDLVIEWKSDVELTSASPKDHRAQLSQYMKATGCSSGAIVYMTLGQVDEVRAVNNDG
jgi:ATP-dependent helicase/nuclease subunit A